MNFPIRSTTRDRLEIIERMESRMGEGFVKRAEHYLEDWDPSGSPIPGRLLLDLASEAPDGVR